LRGTAPALGFDEFTDLVGLPDFEALEQRFTAKG
jgi:hypothetical protein